jgi:hypothetical protein
LDKFHPGGLNHVDRKNWLQITKNFFTTRKLKQFFCNCPFSGIDVVERSQIPSGIEPSLVSNSVTGCFCEKFAQNGALHTMHDFLPKEINYH